MVEIENNRDMCVFWNILNNCTLTELHNKCYPSLIESHELLEQTATWSRFELWNGPKEYVTSNDLFKYKYLPGFIFGEIERDRRGSGVLKSDGSVGGLVSVNSGEHETRAIQLKTRQEGFHIRLEGLT